MLCNYIGGYSRPPAMLDDAIVVVPCTLMWFSKITFSSSDFEFTFYVFTLLSGIVWDIIHNSQ